MKNAIKGAIALVGGGILTLTNPGQEAYTEHLVWQVRDKLSFCRQKELSLPEKAGCGALEAIPPKAIEPVLSSYTRRQNYLFFSIYSTNFMGLKTRTIGIGGHFLMVK